MGRRRQVPFQLIMVNCDIDFCQSCGDGDGNDGDNDGNADDDENALFPLQLLGAGMRMASHIPPLSCTISSAQPPSYTP